MRQDISDLSDTESVLSAVVERVVIISNTRITPDVFAMLRQAHIPVAVQKAVE